MSIQRLRVAMVAACPFPCPRGTPIRIARLSEALARRGHEVHVLTYHLSVGEARGVIVHRTREVRSYSRIEPGPSYQKLLVMDPLLSRLVHRTCREHRYDVIHAHHVEGFVTALMGRPGRIPLIFDAHTMVESELPTYSLGLPKRVLELIGRRIDCALPARADHVIAVTSKIKERFVDACGQSSSKITVVENGIELEHFAPEPAPEPSTRDPLIVFAGNFAPYQGIEHLLRAAALVRADVPSARVLLVTEDEEDLGPYRRLSTNLSLNDAVTVRRVPFHGLPAALASAAVAVNPRSVCDGMPMKVLNYMAAALPIVSFCGSAEGLAHERTALVVPDGDIEGLASAIKRLLGNRTLARRLGHAARDEIRTRSWDRAAEQVEDVYRLFAAKSPRPLGAPTPS